MRIAVNTRLLFDEKLEGVGLFTHEVVRRLVEQHPEDEFILFFDRPFDKKYVYADNVTPVILYPPARHPFLFYIWFEWVVANALGKYRADVFLSPDNFLSLRSKTPTVLVTHDLAHAHFPDWVTFLQRKYYQYFVPKFNRRAERVVAVSEFTKVDIIEKYGISPEKISVACNGCRNIFRPLTEAEREAVRAEFSEGQPYFFYVGAVHPRKNVHRLISAFDRFKATTGSTAKLLIAGRFAWKAGEVKDAFDQAGSKPDIRTLGFVNDADLVRLMGGAMACTYVSLFEGFGIPILEAMHCNVPVITSRGSSMTEVAGDAGLLVDPCSVESIAEAMQHIWQDAHLRNKLVAAGRAQRQRFTWQRAAEVVYQNLQAAAHQSAI